MASPSLGQRVFDLLMPALMLPSAAYHFWAALLSAVFQRGEVLAPILRLSKIKEDGFSSFWSSMPAMPPGASDPAPENVLNSSDLIPPILAKADGVVLDVGPGTGSQTPYFTNPNLRMMYGAEPTEGLHKELRETIESNGMTDKYQILHCGAEPESLIPALDKAGLKDLGEGVFDTVVGIRVLCSVPKPEETIRGLYRLLKPGGKLIVCEHIISPWWTGKGSIIGRLVQVGSHLFGWPFFMGSCHLNRDTEKTLKLVGDEDGGWESVELQTNFLWGSLPYVSGILVKRE